MGWNCILYLTNVILSSLGTPTKSTTSQKAGMMHFNDIAYNEFTCKCQVFACNNIADRPIVWVGFVNAWSAFPHLSLVHINVVYACR